MARPIDADAVLDRYYAEFDRQDICDGSQDRDWLMRCIEEAPTLTQPNEGGKGKNVPTNEPMTWEELKAEAKRWGYKLIKAKRPRFEPCLCGHNVHQWVSGPKGWAVYCKHCGLYGPWAKKSHNAVIVEWNAMISEKRKEQTNG